METELPKEILSLVIESEIPDPYKVLVIDLLTEFRFEWILELYECPNPKGTGSATLSVNIFDFLDAAPTSELHKSLEELTEAIKVYQDIHGIPESDPYEGVSEFVEGIEFIDWEDELMSEKDFKKEILQIWSDARIDYYRSVGNLKIDLAREASYKEIESVNIGEQELCCRTCGVFFYDNLSKHFGVRSLYCSITCEANAVLNCVQCNMEYIVGRLIAKFRLLRLEGFCSTSCLSDFKSARDADNHYRSSMKRRALEFGAKYDQTITRREVFNRDYSVCYICGKTTHFESYEEYSPLLATVDHFVPWTRGGGHTWENVKLCCLRCNMVKGNR